MIYRSFEQLLDQSESGSPARTAVVMAQEIETLQAVVKAWKDGIALPVLIGKKGTIQQNLRQLMIDENAFEICDCSSTEECLEETARLLRSGAVDVVMKDQIKTGDLMKMFVKKENGFLKGTLLSHVAFNELPIYHKLLCITDTSLNVAPDLKGKAELIRNAVFVMKNMGFDEPKVAVMAAVEYENPKMKETVDAAMLKKMNRENQLENCIVEGPISLDLAIDSHAAQIKNFHSPVAGDADLLVVPDLVSGNLLGKAMNYMPQSRFAGFVTGACVPIVLTSRASSTENKYWSLALACAAVC